MLSYSMLTIQLETFRQMGGGGGWGGRRWRRQEGRKEVLTIVFILPTSDGRRHAQARREEGENQWAEEIGGGR